VLSRTVTCDHGLRYDLTCDTCGTWFDADAEHRQDRRRVWRAAQAAGWSRADGPSGAHACPDCPRVGASGLEQVALAGAR
jgi:hypothetical protein